MARTIALGGREFDLRPLRLGQLRIVLDALGEMTGKSGGALIEAAAAVVAAGLKPAHPELTVAAVLELEANVTELNAAVAAVLDAAGLRPAGETRPVASGEGIPDGSSAPSTALSPPAAAMPTARSTS